MDRSGPEFISYTPAAGILNSSMDANKLTKPFDLDLEIVVHGAVVGQPLDVVVTGKTTTPPSLIIGNVTAAGTATITGIFPAEDTFTFTITAHDEHGNTTVLGPFDYELKFSAEVHLRNWSNAIVENTSATWLYASNEDQNGDDPGFNVHLKVQTSGLATNSWVSLCSNKKLQNGSSLGECDTDHTYNIVARAQLQSGTFVYFTDVNLQNETTHELFVEGEDSVAHNKADSKRWGLFTLTLDSQRPSVATSGGVQIVENKIANDQANRIVLSGKGDEGTLSGSSLVDTVKVTLAGTTDGKNADLFLNNVSLTGGNKVAIVNNGGVYSATFSNITLPNGPHTLIARVWDQEGNVSDDAKSSLSVEVDTVAPKVSFVDAEGMALYQTPQCNNHDNAANCLYDIDILVEKKVEDLSSLEGSIITVTLGSVQVPYTLKTDGTQTITIHDFAIPQGAQSLGVVAKDPAGNEGLNTRLYNVDSQVQTVAVTVPSDNVTYLDTDNQDGTCGNGGGLTDLKLRRCDWAIELAGAVSRQTTVELQWRYQGETEFSTFSNAGRDVGGRRRLLDRAQRAGARLPAQREAPLAISKCDRRRPKP